MFAAFTRKLNQKGLGNGEVNESFTIVVIVERMIYIRVARYGFTEGVRKH